FLHQGPESLELRVLFPVQPIGEVPADPGIDLQLAIRANTGLVEVGQFFQKEGPDLPKETIPEKSIDDYVIIGGEFVHPGQPVLQIVVVWQIVKNVGEIRKISKAAAF